MKPLLIEPTDVLFFRDAIPMSAGQGKGAGARMPFPSTLHEAFRASLLLSMGKQTDGKKIPGRPTGAARKGHWRSNGVTTDRFVASTDFRSLQCVGPFPWSKETGLLLPVPSDVALELNPQKPKDSRPQTTRRSQLWRDNSVSPNMDEGIDAIRPLCLPLAVTPATKQGQPRGWWSLDQFRSYLEAQKEKPGDFFCPIPTSQLWEQEHLVGVQIDPKAFAATHGQLYAGDYLRFCSSTRFAVQTHLAKPQGDEAKILRDLDWLLLGGEQRLARLQHEGFDNPFAGIPPVPIPPVKGPCLLKWVLVTPAIFAHGSAPGWCVDSARDRSEERLPSGRVCFNNLSGRAHLVSWCIGKIMIVSGWDVADQHAKPTQLAVPAGSVYYFLCENREVAGRLAERLHWKPRSDFYGEKGCGYGLVSFDVQMHSMSPDVPTLAQELFNG
jgi:CRISPR-associated protein Cmr3